MKDYYSILGVSRNADQEEIKKAYRRLARKYHPDVNRGDSRAEARFKEITEAYEVLGNPEKRRAYDLYGETALRGTSGADPFSDFMAPFEDIFDMFFGRGRRPRSRVYPERGGDLLVRTSVTLKEVYHGTKVKVRVPRLSTCEACGGKGVEMGYELDLCPECGGEGRITQVRRTAFGTISSSRTCPRCGGRGEINTHPCGICEGRGLRRSVEELEVDVPPGVEDGDRIRIPGKGEAGNMGGPPGDLYIEINVEEDPIFHREGSDLWATLSLSVVDAALGTELTVPGLDGDIKVVVPAGSQPGERIRLKGRGLPNPRTRDRGDLYLVLDLEVPRDLSPEQRRLLEEFRRLEEEKAGRRTSIFDRLKKVMGAQN